VPAADQDQRLMCLVIDDMDNVHKKLRSMIPESQVHLEVCMNAQDGLNIARAKKFRLILVDAEIQAGGPAALVKQLRLLQPEAGLWGMALRSANNVTKEMRDLGFDDALLKPFVQEAIDALVEQYATKNESFFTTNEDLIQILPFQGREERLERYFAKLTPDVKTVVQKLGEACFERAVLDITNLALAQPQRVAVFLADVLKVSGDLGLSIRVVGSADLPKALKGFEETKDLRCFSTIEEARSQAA
jgi:two-component system cell cycle response regulator